MTVTAGQVLAVLDRGALEEDVRLGEAELAVCRATLEELKAGPAQSELDALQASYAAALATYEHLKSGPTDQEKAIAAAELRLAERDLQQAQAAYDVARNRPDIGARPEALQLERATIEYDKAKASYELAVAGADAAELEMAMSQVANAKYQLDRAQRGADASALATAEAAVTRAEVGLSRAKLALEQAELKAPFDGVVTAVTESRPGELIEVGQMLVTIADLSQLQIEVEDLDEWGAANVARDQTVDLVVTALNNLTPRGRLSYVSQEPTMTSTGVATYRALITLDQQVPGVLWGMTVRAKLYLLSASRSGFK
jgi:HlyD family secretion protein